MKIPRDLKKGFVQIALMKEILTRIDQIMEENANQLHHKTTKFPRPGPKAGPTGT